jgi:membrane protein
MRKHILLFVAAARDFSANKCPAMAAAVAYWAVLSLFPLALGGLAILGYVFATPEERHRLVLDALEIVPVSADLIEGTLEVIAEERGTLGIVGAVGSIWSGLAVFGALRSGLNQVWRVRRTRSFVKGRLVDFLMFLGLAAGSLATLAYTSVTAATTNVAPQWVRDQVFFSTGVRILVDVGALAITYGAFLLLYRYVPNARVRFGDLWLGALVGAILFQALRIGFAWFASNIGRYNVVYGSLGAVVALMVWAYLSSTAVLWGAQVSESYSRLVGPRASPEAARALTGQYGWMLSPRALRETTLQRARAFMSRVPVLRKLSGRGPGAVAASDQKKQ